MSIKLLCLYLVQYMLHLFNKGTTILSWFRSQLTVLNPTENIKFRGLGNFPVLFKANLIWKDFSRKPSIFKYFSSLWKSRCYICRSQQIQSFKICSQQKPNTQLSSSNRRKGFFLKWQFSRWDLNHKKILGIHARNIPVTHLRTRFGHGKTRTI